MDTYASDWTTRKYHASDCRVPREECICYCPECGQPGLELDEDCYCTP